MVKIFEQFRTWLFQQRDFLLSWFTSDRKETQEPEKSLVELPPSLKEKLVRTAQKLPNNPTEKEAFLSALNETFEQWRSHPQNGDNSLIVLSSPVIEISRIIIESIEDWAKQQQIPVQLLPWTARPYDPEEIKPKLQHQLEQNTITNTPQAEQLEVVVIPNLSWCFLRCLEGLEGIDYLQEMLLRDRDRFWIIGAGKISWEYLNSVCDFQAFCGKIFTLPELKGEHLQTWLKPILAELNITFSESSLDSQLLEEDKDAETKYFDRLASVAEGMSVVAIQAFLSSIRYQENDEDEEEEKNALQAQNPSLPNLPNLEPDDHYLLYSLLLHGDITPFALAHSLGDELAEVQARIQTLRREGIIEQKGEVLKVNPIHYPKLKRELANNNFVIHELD